MNFIKSLLIQCALGPAIFGLLYAPAAFAIDTQSVMDNGVTPYLNNGVIPLATIREADVQANAQSWANDIQNGPYARGNFLAENFISIETDHLKDIQTMACNLSEVRNLGTHLHSYEDLHTFPSFSTQSGLHPVGNICNIHFFIEYEPEDFGVPAGECLNIIYIPIINIFICIWAHLIDYYFPTAKFNFSNKLFYDRYLQAQDTLTQFTNYTVQMGNTNGIWVTRTFFELMNRWNLSYLIANSQGNALQPNVSLLVQADAWLKGGEGFRGRGLIMGEKDIKKDSLLWQPHRKLDQPFFSTDLQMNSALNWLIESKPLNQTAYDAAMSNPIVPCRQNNAASDKTPLDMIQKIDPGMASQATNGGQLNSVITQDLSTHIPCLKNVGDVTHQYHYRRPHTSDGFFQTFIRTLHAYFIWASKEGKSTYTFDQERDRLHFLPEVLNGSVSRHNDEMAISTYKSFINWNCPLFQKDQDGGDMYNMNYLLANQSVIKSREETTAEIFTAFSGCWAPRFLPWMIKARYLPSFYPQTLFGARTRSR